MNDFYDKLMKIIDKYEKTIKAEVNKKEIIIPEVIMKLIRPKILTPSYENDENFNFIYQKDLYDIIKNILKQLDNTKTCANCKNSIIRRKFQEGFFIINEGCQQCKDYCKNYNKWEFDNISLKDRWKQESG